MRLKFNKTNKKNTFGEQLLTTHQIRLMYIHKSFIHCTNIPSKRLDFDKFNGLPNFYPNLPIFLRGYICHICDILQLCLCFAFSLNQSSFFCLQKLMFHPTDQPTTYTIVYYSIVYYLKH